MREILLMRSRSYRWGKVQGVEGLGHWNQAEGQWVLKNEIVIHSETG
jgi:hypothetical protein